MSYANVRFVLGQAWYALDQMEKARDIFERLSSENPSKPAHLLWNAHAACALGAADIAEKNYEAVLKLDSGNVDALSALANLRLDQGRNEEAATLAVRAVSLAPRDAHARLAAGLAQTPGRRRAR